MRRYAKPGAVAAAAMIALSACSVNTPFSGSGATPTATVAAAPARGSAVTSSATNIQTVQAMPPPAASVIAPPVATLPPAPTPVPAMPLPPTKPPASSATIAAMQPMLPVGAASQVVTVTADQSVNVRTGPAIDAAVVTLLPPGTEVAVVEPTVMATDGGTPWVKVSVNGQTGYVRSDLVGMPHPPTTPAAGMTAPTAAPAGAPTATP